MEMQTVRSKHGGGNARIFFGVNCDRKTPIKLKGKFNALYDLWGCMRLNARW